MTITVIVELTAQPGKGPELAATLRDDLYPKLRGNDAGLLGIEQYHDRENPDRIVEVETWEQDGQHAAWAEQAMADGTLNSMLPFMAAAPKITVYDHTGSL